MSETMQSTNEDAALSEAVLVKELSERFVDRFSPEVISDEAYFQRTIYTLDDNGVKLVFRGREELPVLEDEPEVVTGIISIKERPLHTSGDDFGDWSARLTRGNPYGDPFEAAIDEDAEEVLLVANATPLGVVEAAIALVESGIGLQSTAALKELAKKVEDRHIDDSVIDLFDEIIAATLVSADGTVTHRHIGEDGLLQVALSLAGDEGAQELLAAKKALLDAHDEVQGEHAKRYNERSDEDADIKAPGTRLSSDELNILAEPHLVGVHTTSVMPYFLSGSGVGTSVIRPTAEFGSEADFRFPRNTTHFSLNHSVTSHLMGDFDSRPVTIVAPLEKLAELNGSPAVLYGVDTYFASNPGEGVLVPEEAVIISYEKDTTEGPFIQIEGNTIKLRGGPITHEDLKSFADFYMNLSGQDADRLEPLLAALNYADVFTVVAYDDDVKDGVVESEGSPERAEFLKQASDFMNIMKRFLPESREDIRYVNQRMDAITESLRALFTEPGLVEEHPDIQPMLLESIRRVLTNSVIRYKFDSITVKSDGMSAYIENPEFSAAVKRVVKSVGFRTGLHQYNPESEFERAVGEAANAATRTESVPEDLAGNSYERTAANFDWTKYDSAEMWAVLLSAPWATRRTAVDTGVLTYSHREEPHDDEDGGWPSL